MVASKERLCVFPLRYSSRDLGFLHDHPCVDDIQKEYDYDGWIQVG